MGADRGDTGSLHVAAMPFPTAQGTQAAIGSMLRAEASAGRRPALLSYRHGAQFSGHNPGYEHHRASGFFLDRSLRSGPSLAKIGQDLLLSGAMRRPELRHRGPIIAHHVEAMGAALLARASLRRRRSLEPLIFFAHTDLGAELPYYLPEGGGGPGVRLLKGAGKALDGALIRRADRAVALSPLLAQRLSEIARAPVEYVPLPWPRAEPVQAEPVQRAERATARRALALDDRTFVLLYAGNLDAYQGLDVLVQTFARLRSARDSEGGRRGRGSEDFRWLVATESASDEFSVLLRSAGIEEAVQFLPLGDEKDRRRAHAAADLCWIPRGAPGGLPIKLLEGLSRGVPIVASRRALAGLPLGKSVFIVDDEDPLGLECAVRTLHSEPDRLRSLAIVGAHYLSKEHSDRAYLEAIDRVFKGGD